MRVFVVIVMLLSATRTAIAADDRCRHAIVMRAVSPDRVWQAVVDEADCGAGPYASDITATLRVGPVSSAAGVSVLGADTGGHVEDRPRLAWSGAGTLDVTVPNLSFLKVLELHPGDVRVHLRFDPDDPAARQAWLKEHNLAPD